MTAYARSSRKPPGCYQPSRQNARVANGAGRRRESLPPDHSRSRERVSEVRTKLAHVKCANSGRFPIYAGPTFVCPTSLGEVWAGIKPWLAPRHRQSRTGRPARFRDDLARPCIRNGIGLLPFRAPSRVSKRNKFRSPQVCRDAQRRADKLGRHARCASFRDFEAVCQALFLEFHREKMQNRAQLPPAVENRDVGSTFTPGPIVDDIATRLM